MPNLKDIELWCECNRPIYKGGHICSKCGRHLESYWWHRNWEKWFWNKKPRRNKNARLQLEKAELEKLWKENFITQAKEFDVALAKLQSANAALKKQLGEMRDKKRIIEVLRIELSKQYQEKGIKNVWVDIGKLAAAICGEEGKNENT